MIRLLRILPLYGMTLGFWFYVAPHLGHGPFWYQWQPLMESCRKYGWTNWLFVNNFWPKDLANTETRVYHSWYLAVDMLLCIVAPVLIFLYHQYCNMGIVMTFVQMMLSITKLCS